MEREELPMKFSGPRNRTRLWSANKIPLCLSDVFRSVFFRGEHSARMRARGSVSRRKKKRKLHVASSRYTKTRAGTWNSQPSVRERYSLAEKKSVDEGRNCYSKPGEKKRKEKGKSHRPDDCLHVALFFSTLLMETIVLLASLLPFFTVAVSVFFPFLLFPGRLKEADSFYLFSCYAAQWYLHFLHRIY